MISLDEFAPLAVVGVLSLCWLAIGIGTGWIWNRVSLRRLDHDTWVTRPRAFERGGRVYDRVFHIRRWKDRMPEGGGTFRGGFSKARISERSNAHLGRFVAETRRAEYVHWTNAGAGLLFLVFGPLWVMPTMVAFGLLVHLPFVAIQRYNRARLQRTLARRRLRSAGVDLSSPHAVGHPLPT